MEDLLKYTKVVQGAVPVDSTGAAVSGDYINLSLYREVIAVWSFGVSLVATPALTWVQATDNAGTGEKALGFDLAFVNALQGSTDLMTKTTVTSDTIDKSAASNQIIAIRIRASELDVNNDFTHVSARMESPGGNATLTSLVYLVTNAKINSEPMETAID